MNDQRRIEGPTDQRIDAFLSGSARLEGDRRLYLPLLLLGLILMYLTGASPLMLMAMVLCLVVEETYHAHCTHVRNMPRAGVTRRRYRWLLMHFAASVAGYSCVAVLCALHGSVVGIGTSVMLMTGQLLNAISYETRSRETTLIAAVLIAATFQASAFAVGHALGLPWVERLMLNGGAFLLSVYATHVLMAAMDTRNDLIARTEALMDSTRTETVGRLTSGIAHDFNNLLTVMRGNLDLIEEVPETDRPVLLRDIAAATDRGSMLVRKLLDQNQRQPRDRRRVALPDFLDDFRAFARRVVPTNIEMIVECEHDLDMVVEPHLLEAALLNIVVNARDAMPVGGRLTIVARAAPPPDEEAEDQAWLILRVADTGCGMPADVLATATDPLMTTKPAGQGTGLGLAMVQAFVRGMGGRLDIESRPGDGTSVALHLPQR